MIVVKTLTHAYDILEHLLQILRKPDSHQYIDGDDTIFEFEVTEDGGNNGVWRAQWTFDEKSAVSGFELEEIVVIKEVNVKVNYGNRLRKY